MAGAYLDETEISAERARELVDAGGAWLLDVRELHEWEAGHAARAHHIPLYEIEARQHELPDAEQIIVVCHTGMRSAFVTDALLRADYPTANLAGGMDAWQRAGGEVVCDDGTPGAII